MQQYLEETGLFTVDIARTAYTWRGEEYLEEFKLTGNYSAEKESKIDPNFNPDFSAYDVIISNFGWKAASWPEKTQRSLEDFVNQGGGLVVVHAADKRCPYFSFTFS